MNNSKNLLLGAALALSAAAPVANAQQNAVDVSASAAIASTYLWRGIDLGSGTPAISGDITASTSGFYAGVWGSSGDKLAGTEYDLYAGYGFELENGFSADISVWNYVYPTAENGTLTGGSANNVGDLSEIILTLGYGAFSFSYYDNVAGATGYEYYTLGASFGDFSVTLGMHDNEDAPGGAKADDPVHLDVAYAYNDNLTFTLSQFVEDEPAGAEDVKFVVSYSIPIE